MAVAIITDSDASLPFDLAEKNAIQIVPIDIHFDGQSFHSGIDITDAEMFNRIEKSGKLPTTSAPTPGNFLQAYQAAFDAGAEAVVCICVSSQMSATYQSARIASEQFIAREDNGTCDITVIDSLSVTMGQGFMALAAAQAARSGGSKEDIIAAAVSVGKRSHIFGSLTTLKYLAMSGRVGKAVAGMAGLLDIKPILTLRGGKLDMLERIRTRRRARARVIELARESLANRSIERIAIVHADCLAEAEEYKQQVMHELHVTSEIIISEFTPGLSVHTGPGLLGLVIVCAEDHS